MKKRKKKNHKIKKKKRVRKPANKRKIKKTIKKKIFKKKKKYLIRSKKNILLKTKNKLINNKNILLKLIRIQENIKSKFFLSFKFDIFKIDRAIQNFFQKIDKKIEDYKIIKVEERKRMKIEAMEKANKEKEKEQKNKIEEEKLQLKLKEKQIKEEEKLERERSRDIKLFLRKEQAILRKEQAERQKRFLQELKLEKQIEKFRIREVKELEQLEKISLKEQREDYTGLQDRIEKLKEKYRLIRDQKIRERVEALGVKTFEDDDREKLLKREKEYNLARQKIEFALESFYRSASSLVFQLNKRHITRNMSIFRCIDRRFETGEIFIKWDESSDEEWLILIYIKDNSPDKGIVIEDKSNPERNLSHEFNSNEIFKASDLMVDSLTQLLAKERSKKASL